MTKQEKPKGDFSDPKSFYFNDYLSNHIGHKLEVVEYCCGVCGKTTDFMLRCFQDDIDDTCFNDPAGIAREWVKPHCECNHSPWTADKISNLKENLTESNQAE
jgi:hypothetical protein